MNAPKAKSYAYILMTFLCLVAACRTTETTSPPTATSFPNVTAAPTSTKNPTDTPVPPTYTPLPTATPQPTDTLLPSATPTSRPPLSGSGGGVIAFVSDRDGNDDIYLMNADGSDQRNITNNPFTDTGPNWAPDHSQIVFESTRDGNYEIYTSFPQL